MFNVWPLAFAFISVCPAVVGVQIKGAIVDPSGALIGSASVRFLDSAAGTVGRTRADESGNFQIGIAAPGKYVLIAWQRGFRSRRVPVVMGTETAMIDLGRIELDLAGCDAPGVICDSVGEPAPPDREASRGYLNAQAGCLLVFTRNKVSCPGDASLEGSEKDADIRITEDEAGVYLTAMNGAVLSAPDLPRGDCLDAHPKEARIRIDGLGPGDDICLYTHDRHWSHVFPAVEVSGGPGRITLWQITRKR